MKHFTIYMLLIIFAIMFGICLSTDDCYYRGMHQGKKCFDTNSHQYRCCSLDYYCENGQCLRIGADPLSKPFPFSIAIATGVGASVVCLVCLVIGAVYWHRKQINNTEKRLSPLSSFSQPLSRSGSSAGFRINSSTSKETSVNLEPSIITKP